MTAKNIFFHSRFEEGQEFQISCEYGGKNLKAIKNLTFLPDASVVAFDFERAENVDYDAIETVKVTINKEETYQLTMHFARQMKEKGLITDPELQAIDTMMRQKYQPIFVTFIEQI